MKSKSAKLVLLDHSVRSGCRGNDFLPLRTFSSMDLRSFCQAIKTSIVVLLFGLSSCKGPQLVNSSDVEKEVKKDSSTVVVSKKDSSVYRETVKETTVPQSVIDFNIGHVQKLDSVIVALKSLPKGVPQVITIPDKSGHAMLQLLLDSIGGLHARCTALEQKHFDKEVNQLHYINSLTKELTDKNVENSSLKTTVLQLKKPWYERFWDSIDSWFTKMVILFIIIGLAIIITRGGWAWIKNFTWAGILNVFKRSK